MGTQTSIDTAVESKGATFSPCKQFRYVLYRIWDTNKPMVMFIGLNPSTADAEKDDATIRRCRGFAKREGMGGMVMVNLYAYRATDPKELIRRKCIGLPLINPVEVMGENNHHVMYWRNRSKMVIFCWGQNDGKLFNRGKDMNDLITDGLCFGKNKDGHPLHPLYLPSDTPLIHYND